LSSRGLRRVPPGTLIPAAFAINAALLLADWAFASSAPRLTAQALYLQVSGLGPMLGSGFWLIVTEHFDPHTARRIFGRIGAAGTVSGLGSGPLGMVIQELVRAAFLFIH